MRRALPLLLAVLWGTAMAQKEPPPGLQPVPDPPPPPRVQSDPDLEPQVTIVKRGDELIEEYRVAGRLVMIKVTPRNGPSYFLVDQRGDGRFVRQESLDTGLRVPLWVIFSF